MKFLCFILCISAATSESNCPQSWNIYRSTEIGPYKTIPGYDFRVSKKVFYKICQDNSIRFSTKHELILPSNLSANGVTFSGFGLCEKNCYEKQVTIKVFVPGWSNALTFSYENRNCNKLYWTSWFESTNCSSSSIRSYSRQCFDCDFYLFRFQQYCPGKAVKQERCEPIWSEWSAGKCVSKNCSFIGERVRTKKCLHSCGGLSLSSRHPNVTEKCYVDVSNCTVTKHCDGNQILVLKGILIVGGILFCCIISVLIWLRLRRFCIKPDKNLSQDRNISSRSYTRVILPKVAVTQKTIDQNYATTNYEYLDLGGSFTQSSTVFSEHTKVPLKKKSCKSPPSNSNSLYHKQQQDVAIVSKDGYEVPMRFLFQRQIQKQLPNNATTQ